MTFVRKKIRLPADRYMGKQIYFVTICCQHRLGIFTDAEIVQSFLKVLEEEASRNSFAVHAFCFMPDHLHVLVEGNAYESSLVRFISSFKQRTAFAYRRKGLGGLWQPRFHDHIVRSCDAIHDVALYIWMNPVRAGICVAPLEYPFSGSLSFAWKEGEASGARAWVPPWKGR